MLKAVDRKMPVQVQHFARQVRNQLKSGAPAAPTDFGGVVAQVEALRRQVQLGTETVLDAMAFLGRAVQEGSAPVEGTSDGFEVLESAFIARQAATLETGAAFSLGGGTGLAERMLAALGHPVRALAPWPNQWGFPELGVISVAELEGAAASARLILLRTRSADSGARGSLDVLAQLRKLCTPGCIVLYSGRGDRALVEEPAPGTWQGWRPRTRLVAGVGDEGRWRVGADGTTLERLELAALVLE
jgi:hypothetical protein